MPNDRRDFLKQVGTAAAAVAAVKKFTEQPAEAAVDKRGYSSGKFALELDGQHAGWLQSFDGGQATADVVTEKQGEDGIVRKHIAGVKYEDITVTCGANMSKAFFEWISDTFAHKGPLKSGSLIAMDFNFNTVAALSFANAFISEIGFPALDASSKDAAKLTLKFSPEVTEYKHGEGRAVIQDFTEKQQKWTPANFRLRIDGMKEAPARVNKIEALTIKQQIVESPIGESRDFEQFLKVEIPNLKITLPEHNADEVFGWHEDFVIKGNNGQEQEKGGTLEFLTSDLKTTLFAIDFANLGIFKFNPDPYVANSDSIRRVSAEMYCEEMKFRTTAKPISTDAILGDQAADPSGL